MTYIDYLNDFNQWLETNALPVSSQLMYFRLLNIFNRAGWPEDVGVDNLRLQLMIDAKSEKTAIHARDKLVEAGFITYRKGKKSCPNRYTLRKYTVNNDGVSDSVYTSINDSVCDSTNDSHIKTKTKNKNTPYSPPGGERGISQPKYQPEWFARFWELYPRKTNRAAAVKAWDKLRPDRELCDIMAEAIRVQARSQQWQDPQHIPHPSTWLNGERWYDEMSGGKETGIEQYF